MPTKTFFGIPDALGKFLIAAMVGAFTVGIWIANAEREHAQLRDVTAKNAQTTASNTAQFVGLSMQMQEVQTELKKDQQLAEERREVTSRDQQRTQRMLEQILESIQ